MQNKSNVVKAFVAVAVLVASLLGLLLARGVRDVGASGDVKGWILAEDGSVLAFGGAPFFGDASGSQSPAVSIESSLTGQGYYLVLADGTVEVYGDAVSQGDVSHLDLTRPIVDMSVSATGDGYVMVAGDGGVFTFGSLDFWGSAPQIVPVDQLEGAAVGLLPSPDGSGYGIVFEDGGIFNFGDSLFYGSLPGIGIKRADLDGLVVAAVLSNDSLGYGMVADDGGVFSFGSYDFLGSLAASGLTYVSMDVDSNGGYAMVSEGGEVRIFHADGTDEGFTIVNLVSPVVDLALQPAPVPPTTTTAPGSTSTTSTTVATTTSSSTTSSSTTSSSTTSSSTTTTTSTSTTLPTGAVVIFGPHTQEVGPEQYFTPPEMITTGDALAAKTAGIAMLELAVLSKPSDLLVDYQVCFWNVHDPFWLSFDETCSAALTADDEFSSVVFNLATPDSWWTLDGMPFPWAEFGDGLDIARVMVKDNATQKLLLSINCGSSCYEGTDLADHVPIEIRATLTFGS